MKEKRSTKAKSKQLAQVTIVAKRLVCDASLALDLLAALRLHTTNKHIPLIRTLRISVRKLRRQVFVCNRPTALVDRRSRRI